MSRPFKKPYYIQRLLKPSGHQPFSDGMLGFNENTLKHLNENVFSFDYMGSSEFEFGAIPKAFREIGKRMENNETWAFAAMEFTVKGKLWEHGKEPEVFEKTMPIYILTPKEYTENVVDFIGKEARGEDTWLKERTQLFDSCVKYGTEEDLYEPVGWFDLENHFFFFIDEKTALNTKAAMGLSDIPGTKQENIPVQSAGKGPNNPGL